MAEVFSRRQAICHKISWKVTVEGKGGEPELKQGGREGEGEGWSYLGSKLDKPELPHH